MRGVLMIVLLIGATIAPASARQETISKTEARSLPPAEVERRILRQLFDILKEHRPSQRTPPVNPLTEMYFAAEPRATEVPSLCRIDGLTVTFSPPRSTEKQDADTQMRVDGFEAEHQFHFKAPPTEPYEEITRRAPERQKTDCRGVDGWKDEIFAAPDEPTATDGYLAAHRALDAMITQKAGFPTSCDKRWSEKGRECSDIAQDFKRDQILAIDSCEADISKFGNALCFVVRAGDRSLRIIASGYSYGRDVPPPLTILSADMSNLIVLVHERTD